MQTQIVRAIDVGYGNTKYTMFHTPGDEVACATFPSIAPQASAGPDLSGGVFQKRNTHVIAVGNVRYEVGKDARLAQDASYGRILDPAYSLSDPYLALVRGAIAYMDVPKVDMLVLGLPVNTFEQYQQALADRVAGEHEVPDAYGAYRKVHIAQVRVLPQPIGGLFDHAVRHNVYGRMRNQMNLLIDPGYYTLDWVTAQGVKMINARSGAHAGGMSAILATMGEAISRKLGSQLTDYSAIDDAMRNGTNPRFYGREFDISEYVELAKAKARQFIAVLANKVGNSADIDNIVLVGGGAQFFKDVVQEKFPNHNIVIGDDPIYANVRGFQFAGEQMANAAAFNAQRTGVAA